MLGKLAKVCCVTCWYQPLFLFLGLILDRVLSSLEGHCHLSRSSDLYSRILQCIVRESRTSPALVAANFSAPPPEQISRLWSVDCGGPVKKHTTAMPVLGLAGLDIIPYPSGQLISTYRMTLLQFLLLCSIRRCMWGYIPQAFYIFQFYAYMLSTGRGMTGLMVLRALARCSRARSISGFRARISFQLPFVSRPVHPFRLLPITHTITARSYLCVTQGVLHRAPWPAAVVSVVFPDNSGSSGYLSNVLLSPHSRWYQHTDSPK